MKWCEKLGLALNISKCRIIYSLIIPNKNGETSLCVDTTTTRTPGTKNKMFTQHERPLIIVNESNVACVIVERNSFLIIEIFSKKINQKVVVVF